LSRYIYHEYIGFGFHSRGIFTQAGKATYRHWLENLDAELEGNTNHEGARIAIIGTQLSLGFSLTRAVFTRNRCFTRIRYLNHDISLALAPASIKIGLLSIPK
jgi:hypothetical protein